MVGFHQFALVSAALVYCSLSVLKSSRADQMQGSTATMETRSQEKLTLSEHRKRLISYVFSRYDKRVQPDNTPQGALNVSIRLAIGHIIHVDDRTQTINIFCWLFQAWPDHQLHWNPENFGGIDFLVVPHDMVWLPDTYLSTSSSLVMDKNKVQNPMNVKIETVMADEWTSDGIHNVSFDRDAAIVRLMHPTKYSFSCPMYMNYFPFDIQHCELVLASISQDVSGIDYWLGGANAVLESYRENEEWDMISVEQLRRVMQYECCEHGFATVVWKITIRRKSLYHLVNLIVPTVIVNLLATVGLFATKNGQPTGSVEDKVNLGVTTLLAFSILLLTVSDQIPKGSTCVPLIGWFLLSIMIQTALSTLMSIYISCPRRRRDLLRMLNWCRPLRTLQERALHIHHHHHRQRENPDSSTCPLGIDFAAQQNGDVMASAIGLDRRAILAAAWKARKTSYELECQTAVVLPETFCMCCCLAFLFLTSMLPVYGFLSTRHVKPQ